jgi:hypothetical protein
MAERSGYGRLPCLVHRRLPGLGLFISRAGSLTRLARIQSAAMRHAGPGECQRQGRERGLTSRIAALLSRPGPWTLPRIRVVLSRERTRRRRQDLNRALQLGHLAPELPDPLEASVVTPGA